MDNLLAYIDPGTGSLIFQMLIAGLMGAMFIFRKLFSIPLSFLARLFRRPTEEENDS